MTGDIAVILTATQQVQPSILEEFIKDHFEVQAVVVVGVPGDFDIGHLPTALVVLPSNSTVSEALYSLQCGHTFLPRFGKYYLPFYL